MEHWIEINLDAEVSAQDGILLDILRPHVRRMRRSGVVLGYHYFREPEIRFRVRLVSHREKTKEVARLSRLADSMVRKKLVSSWHFGSHGEEGAEYHGEEDRYGRNGWKVAQGYFEDGSETALRLLELKRRSRLENPLWGSGKGNPWEGGGRNPWRDREEDPLAFHWSRLVHLVSNQMGFGMEAESKLCAKQSERYSRVVREFGMKW